MAFYYEYFVEKENELIHIASSTGSDSPTYFQEVESIEDWKKQLKELSEYNNFFPHNDEKHPFPWKTYKTSDESLVLRKTNKWWFEFWKPAYQVWISVNKRDVDDDNKSYFVPIDKWFSNEGYEKKDLVLLEFPKLERGF